MALQYLRGSIDAERLLEDEVIDRRVTIAAAQLWQAQKVGNRGKRR